MKEEQSYTWLELLGIMFLGFVAGAAFVLLTQVLDLI